VPTAGIYLILTPEPRTGKSIVPNLHVKIIVNGSMRRNGAKRTPIAWPTSKDKPEPGIRPALITAVKGGPVTRPWPYAIVFRPVFECVIADLEACLTKASRY